MKEAGIKYGRLTIVEEKEKYISPKGYPQRRVLCKCECGNTHICTLNNLKNGSTKSCGCYQKELASRTKSTHGMSGSRPHSIWNQMIMRCHNPKSRGFKNYGAKGITVCEKWKTFEGFWEDMSNGYKDNLTIDRINNSKGYSKSNCKWSTPREQQNNRSNNRKFTFDGETLTMMQWARKTGLKRQTIESRLRRGWTVENALTTHIMKHSILNNK